MNIIAIPIEFIDYLAAGKLIVVEAKPGNPKFDTISLAINMRAIYEMKHMPDGGIFVNKKNPIVLVPPEVNAEELICAYVSAVVHRSDSVGGVKLEFSLADPDTTKMN